MILLSCSGCCRKDCITPKAGTHRSSETAAPLKPKYSHRPKRNPHTVRAKFAEYHKGKANNPKCNSPHIIDADLLMPTIAEVLKKIEDYYISNRAEFEAFTMN